MDLSRRLGTTGAAGDRCGGAQVEDNGLGSDLDTIKAELTIGQR
jgi:hypothetical protein